MSGSWWACAEPEKPTDMNVVWHYHDCLACRLKASVQQVLHPNDPHVAWLVRMMTAETAP